MTTSFHKSALGVVFALLALGSAKPAQAQLPKATTVLVVDDFASMRNIVRNYLVQMGFKAQNIVEATTGAQALEKIAEKNFDLVISDWNMDPMTGLELLKTLKAEPKTDRIPFIMTLAESKEDPNTIKAIHDTKVEYIVKPFNVNTLRLKMEKVMDNF